jgi:hypothetical protein
VIDAMFNRTRQFYDNFMNINTLAGGENSFVGRPQNRLKSFALPAYDGDNQDRRFQAADWTEEEKRDVIENLLLSNAEEVDALPGISEKTDGVKIMRAYYRQCVTCSRKLPIGQFCEGFLCSDCV